MVYMSFISETNNSFNTVRYYRPENVKSDISALRWLNSVREKKEITVDYIVFRDLLHRSDEGSDSIWLDGSIGSFELEEVFLKHEADLISMNGEFNGKPIVIGYDFRVHNIFLTTRKNTPADIAALEDLLQL